MSHQPLGYTLAQNAVRARERELSNHPYSVDRAETLLATAVHAVVQMLLSNPSGLTDTLRATFKGPVWDGDVPSKRDRDIFLELGCLVKIVNGGEQGFQAMTYFGYSVWKAYQEEVAKEAENAST